LNGKNPNMGLVVAEVAEAVEMAEAVETVEAIITKAIM
jgi:hypothetical protein